jgi:uncharacterized DUF497 family protein
MRFCSASAQPVFIGAGWQPIFSASGPVRLPGAQCAPLPSAASAGHSKALPIQSDRASVLYCNLLQYAANVLRVEFEWDDAKEQQNIARHGVNFEEAEEAFKDPLAVIVDDDLHSQFEPRYFCFGQVLDEILTVRFTPSRRSHSHHWSRILEKRQKTL